ncbi:MAG: tRNA glutamyl-Q(34) synthetase GluQRS [Pseudomonadota bacterium]
MVERFAPSPTGRLHLGHAYSALTAHDAARAAGGRFLLRLEDLDAGRVRAPFVEAIVEDLAWLGVLPDGPVWRQSTRARAYDAALHALVARGLAFRCACTRRDIQQAVAAPQEGAVQQSPPGAAGDWGLEGPIYPGTCLRRPPAPQATTAWRLNMGAALATLGAEPLRFREIGRGPQGQRGIQTVDPDALRHGAGDIVLARKDGAAAYHLAVVVDDAAQGVTHVTRGEDLFAATPVHRLLQALLGLATPVYRHHRLVRDDAGRRLAKRDDARSLESLRAAGATPASIRANLRLGPPPDTGAPSAAR